MFFHRYTNITNIRKSGIGTDIVSDSDLWRIIENVSDFINKRTGQIFSPAIGTFSFNGNGNNYIYHSNLVPILGVSKIRIDLDRTKYNYIFEDSIVESNLIFNEYGIYEYDSTTYDISEDSRYIEFIANTSDFTKGVRNIWVTGAIGWLANHPHRNKYISTTLASNLELNSSSLIVDAITSTTGSIEVGDSIDIVVSDEESLTSNKRLPYQKDTIQVIVKTINYVTKTITFDRDDLMYSTVAKIDTIIPEDSEVICYGRIPSQITKLTDFLVKKEIYETVRFDSGISTDVLCGPVGKNPFIRDRVLSETIDNYSYRLYQQDVTKSGIGTITGSIMMDSILEEFSAPPVWIAV